MRRRTEPQQFPPVYSLKRRLTVNVGKLKNKDIKLYACLTFVHLSPRMNNNYHVMMSKSNIHVAMVVFRHACSIVSDRSSYGPVRSEFHHVTSQAKTSSYSVQNMLF